MGEGRGGELLTASQGGGWELQLFAHLAAGNVRVGVSDEWEWRVTWRGRLHTLFFAFPVSGFLGGEEDRASHLLAPPQPQTTKVWAHGEAQGKLAKEQQGSSQGVD